MSTIGEIEKLTGEYEKKIEKLKRLEKELADLNTDGFEKEASEIKKYIKDPKSLEKVEKDIKILKTKAKERKKREEESRNEIVVEKEPPKTYPRFSPNFPYIENNMTTNYVYVSFTPSFDTLYPIT